MTRTIEEIRETGAGWITEEELEYLCETIDRLLQLIKDAPCPHHYQRDADKGICGCCNCEPDCPEWPCDCWKREALD